MNLEPPSDFFGWCTIFNAGLLLVSVLLQMLAGGGIAPPAENPDFPRHGKFLW